MFKCLASVVVLSTGICLGQSFVGSDMAPGTDDGTEEADYL